MKTKASAKGRRDFIKRIGIGTGGLVGVAAGGLIIGGVGGYFGRSSEVSSLQGKVDSLTKDKSDLVPRSVANVVGLKTAGWRYTTWVAFSKANTIDGVDHRVAMQGVVRFNPDQKVVDGGGSFVHFDNAPPTPKPILASGLWEAKEFLSHSLLTPPAIYGKIEAGILTMNINLLPDVGPNAGKVIPAILRPVCNIGALGPAGSTGEPEGYTLTIPGTPFATDVAAGPFKPLSPTVLGITHISVVG
jgi:hypothetical protein